MLSWPGAWLSRKWFRRDEPKHLLRQRKRCSTRSWRSAFSASTIRQRFPRRKNLSAAEQLRNTDKQRDECSRAVHELGNQFQTSKLGFLGRTRRGIAEKHDMSSAVAACFYVLHAVVPSNQHANLSRVSIVIVAVILSLGVGDYCVRHLLYAAN